MIDRDLPESELARLITLARCGAPGDATAPETIVALVSEIRRLREDLRRTMSRTAALERAETATAREIERSLVDALESELADYQSSPETWSAVQLAIDTIRRLEADLEERVRVLGRQYERAHVEEMKQVARMAFEALDAHGEPLPEAEQGAAFEQWWRDHVQAPDGVGIRIR